MKTSKRIAKHRLFNTLTRYYKFKYNKYGMNVCCCGDYEENHTGYSHNHSFVSEVDWVVFNKVKDKMKLMGFEI